MKSLFKPPSQEVYTDMKPRFTKPVILLHPNIPKPLHGMSPRALKGGEWWDKERQKAYAKNNYCCWACGIHKSKAKYHNWLEAHECYEYNYPRGTAKMIMITALCHSCHNSIHSGRMQMMVNAGEMAEEKFVDILAHGLSIRTQIPQETKNPFIVNDGISAEWGEWRLILDGKEYKSKFQDRNEWLQFYSK